MLKHLRKIDKGLADGEAALIAFTLIVMIVLALVQALLGRFRDWGADWAIAVITRTEWIDPFLKMATVWISFLGASLATYHDKHIGIDIVSRFVPVKPRGAIAGLVKISSGAITLLLAAIFWTAVVSVNTPSMMDIDYSVMTPDGDVHICDATAEQISTSGKEEPAVYCSIRSLFNAIGAPAHNPNDTAFFIMPFLFVVIGVRLIAKGIGSFIALATNQLPSEEALERLSSPGFSSSEIPLPEKEDDPDDRPRKGGQS